MGRYLNQVHFVLVFSVIIYFGFFASNWSDGETTSLDAASNVIQIIEYLALILEAKYTKRYICCASCFHFSFYFMTVCRLCILTILTDMESGCCVLFLLPIFFSIPTILGNLSIFCELLLYVLEPELFKEGHNAHTSIKSRRASH